MRLGVPLLIGCLCLLAAPGAAQMVTLASELTRPTALAYVPGPTGGFRLLVAEETGGLTELTILGEGVLSRRSIGVEVETPIVGIGWYNKQVLAATPASGGLIDLVEGASPQPLTLSEEAADAGPWIGPVSLSERWLFVPARDGLLRGRLASGRVMGLRRMAPAVLAADFTPAGYLATLDATLNSTLGGDGASGFRLSYRDPEKPAELIASYAVDGLSTPAALAVRPTDATLYALQAAQGEAPTRLARLDISGQTAGPIRAVATPIEGTEGVTAMAFDPAGVLYLATDSGRIVRLEDEL